MIYQTWEELEEGIKECQKCKLHSTRKQIVFGCGNKKARLMLIGEGPGADEDTIRRALCRKSRTIDE